MYNLIMFRRLLAVILRIIYALLYNFYITNWYLILITISQIYNNL